jgi:hypothetical protein
LVSDNVLGFACLRSAVLFSVSVIKSVFPFEDACL